MRGEWFCRPHAATAGLGLLLLSLGCGDRSKTTEAAGGAVGAGGTTSNGVAGGSSGGGGASNAVSVPWSSQIRTGAGQCLEQPLSIGSPGTAEDGRTTCQIAEVKTGACDCSTTGRAPLAAESMNLVRPELMAEGLCGENIGIKCDSYCGCEIRQLSGTASDTSSDLYACQNSVTVSDSTLTGFCVLDAQRTKPSGEAAPLGNPQLLTDCPAKAQRRIRFVGANTPANGTVDFLVCR